MKGVSNAEKHTHFKVIANSVKLSVINLTKAVADCGSPALVTASVSYLLYPDCFAMKPN